MKYIDVASFSMGFLGKSATTLGSRWDFGRVTARFENQNFGQYIDPELAAAQASAASGATGTV